MDPFRKTLTFTPVRPNPNPGAQQQTLVRHSSTT